MKLSRNTENSPYKCTWGKYEFITTGKYEEEL